MSAVLSLAIFEYEEAEQRLRGLDAIVLSLTDAITFAEGELPLHHIVCLKRALRCAQDRQAIVRKELFS